MDPATLEITSALRSALKARGVTYKQVADKLDVSEQTIKRLFREKDCSLSRLNAICNAINLSVYDLLEFARHESETLTELSSRQEHYLSERPGHFMFLFLLTTHHTLDDIQSAYDLSDHRVFEYLRDLDRTGLLELGAENSFRLKIEGKLLMRLKGPMRDIVRRLNHQFLDYVVNHDAEEGVSFNSSFRYMTKVTLAELNDELMAVTKKYRKLAYQNEMVLPRKKLVPVKWTTLVAPFEICGQWELD